MRYAKFIIAGLAAGAVALQAAITDDVVTTAEWVGIGISVLGALGVWLVPNKPPVDESLEYLRSTMNR